MKSLTKQLFVFLMIMFGAVQMNAQSKYKLMLQMTNYDSHEAYLVVSLINSKGEYEKTLAVMGDDRRWYKSIKEWYKAQQKRPEQLSAITGASVGSGDRNSTLLTIDDTLFNKGYKLRIESAVEDGKYYVEDATIPLTTTGFSEKIDGKGYVRFVKLNKM